MQLQEEKKSLKYFHTIEFLPIGCFNKIIDTGDLRYLLKLDDYEELPECSLDLTETWENIVKQYLELSKNTSHKTEIIFWIEREILGLKAEYKLKLYLLYAAGIRSDKQNEFIEQLKEYGIYLKNDENFKKQLDAEIKKVGGIKTKILIKQKEIERLKDDGDNEITFDDLLINIEKFRGPVDIWSMPVKKWISILKNYEKYCKEIEKINGRGKNK